MNVAESGQRIRSIAAALALSLLLTAAVLATPAAAQTDASAGKAVGDKPGAAKQETPAASDHSAGKVVGDTPSDKPQQEPDKSPATAVAEKPAEDTAAAPSLIQNAAERKRTASSMLQDAVTDDKHPQTRIQALAALGLLRSPDSERMIGNAMLDADVDVRTAAALAAGQTRDPNLTTSLRNLLDDKEPQVAFTAALTLAKMGDRSGEDILMAVVDGDRRTQAGVLHGTEHKISRELHNPAKLAKLGATQGAAMLLGPFGFGITAIEFIRQNGGDAARAAAIEQIAQEKTEPIHRELLDALKDKDPGVRAAAAKALVDYHDQETQDAVYSLLLDPKDPARLTAAAAYLRIMGVPGPLEAKPLRPAVRSRRRLPAKTVAR
jgi:hypothetical protein